MHGQPHYETLAICRNLAIARAAFKAAVAEKPSGKFMIRSRTRVVNPRGRLVIAMRRYSIWIAVLIGSTIGGLIPGLWGGDTISYSGVLLSGIGAFVGLWLGAKFSN